MQIVKWDFLKSKTQIYAVCKKKKTHCKYKVIRHKFKNGKKDRLHKYPTKKRVTTLISDNVDLRGMNIIQGLEDVSK